MAKSTKRADKRLQILAAANEVFARYGYDKTTLEDIGRRCGLNKASLYYYFKNKEELFARTVLEDAAAFLGRLQETTRQLRGTEAKVQHYVTERLRYYGEVVALHQLSLENLQKVEPLFDQLYDFIKQKEIDFIGQLLWEAVDTGEITDVDLDEVAESIFLISDAFKQEALRQANVAGVGEADFEGLGGQVKSVIRLIFRGLQK